MTEISPEEFRRRLAVNSTTPEDKRVRCPDCESVNVAPRNPGKSIGDHHREGDHDYVCETCGERFDAGEAL